MTVDTREAKRRREARALMKNMSPELRSRVQAQLRHNCECRPTGWGYFPHSFHDSTDQEVRFRSDVEYGVYFIMSRVMSGDLAAAEEDGIRLVAKIRNEREERIRGVVGAPVIDIKSYLRLQERRR